MNTKINKVILINVPSRKGMGGFFPPLGLIYAGSIIERCGHKVKIVDPYLGDVNLNDFDSGNFDNIYKKINEYKPTIIGYGGIATSYGRTKRLAQQIRNDYPGILQIAGGALSSAYELLLTKAKIDLVFNGETEVSLPIFLEKLAQGKIIYDTPGISYLLNGGIIKNPSPEQIGDLDTIPLPNYNLIDITNYFRPMENRLELYKFLLDNNHYSQVIKRIQNKKPYYFSIVTSRGCTHSCSFCYRHVRGIRQHSINYIIRHIKYLKDRYGIQGFDISDELFNSSPKWVMEFCDALEKEKLDIFYLVGGARIDKINEEILYRMKNTGCIEINYGHESGSDVILKEYKKGVTRHQNKEITLLTSKKIGIACPVQLVIGSPSETSSTVYQTIQFLKEINAFLYSLNYLIPLPETPIWKYTKEYNLISDVDKYLDLVAEYGGAPLINLTRENEKIWKNWSLLIRKELNLHYYKRFNWKYYYFYKLLYSLIDIFSSILPSGLKRYIPGRLESWCWALRK